MDATTFWLQLAVFVATVFLLELLYRMWKQHRRRAAAGPDPPA